MDKVKKNLKRIIYLMAGIIAVVSLLIFVTSTLKGGLPFKKFRETTGVLLEILLGIETALFVGITVLKHRWYPKEIKKYLVECVKILREFHRSIGILALAALLLHFSVSLNILNLWGYHMVTGYFITGFIILSIVFAFSKNKMCKKLHITFSLIAIIPFLLHI